MVKSLHNGKKAPLKSLFYVTVNVKYNSNRWLLDLLPIIYYNKFCNECSLRHKHAFAYVKVINL